jgi:transglutaminase-like putative cysteine protease
MTITSIMRALAGALLALLIQPAHADGESPAREQRDYTIEAIPDWVRDGVPAPQDTKTTEASDGVEYLAVDRQVRLHSQGADIYAHFVERIVSQAGVEDQSTITIDFDPQSERIALHSLQVLRGGGVIDQLKVARLSLLQRESRLEQGLLDGNLTLSIVLEDIRPGDIIGYSYSRHCSDATLGNRYFDTYTTQWSTPVHWSRLRLLQPADRNVHILETGMHTEPVITRHGGLQETVWQWHDLAGIPDEEDRPSWHILYPRIALSEWWSWREVVDWAVPLYRRGSLSPEMTGLVEVWRRSADSEAERIMLALRFVQDEVRYTGIEIGPGAYQPTDAARVLQRRYGDCKDKVMLLVTLLDAMGIDARAALVNTDLQHEILKSLPSPGAFDHAIVRVRSGGQTYWFDATNSLQGGSLRTTVQARYGAALVIEPGVRDFEKIAPELLRGPTTEVTENFDLKAGIEGKGALTVTTIYRGEDADAMRSDLQSSTSEEISRKYVDYYRDWYPGIKQAAPLRSRDNRHENRIEVTERYDIEPAFAKEDDGSFRFDVNPHIVVAEVKAPKQTHRTTPLAVDHPVNVRYSATVLLPEAWDATGGAVTIEDPAFEYHSNVTYSKQRFNATYDFHTRADHVDAARAAEYARKLKQVRDDASYWFTHGGKARPAGSTTTNIILSLGAALGLGAGVALGRWLRRRVPVAPNATPADAPVGLRGWLIFPVLHTCLLPLSMLSKLWTLRPLFGMSGWNEIGAGQGDLAIQLLQLGYFALVVSGCTMLVATAHAVYMMFTRQRTYPFAYILLTWGIAGWALINLILSLIGPDLSGNEIDSALNGMVLFIALAAFGTTYVLNSRRVTATFTRDGSRPPAVVAPEPASA